MDEILRRLRVLVQNLVTRVVVDRSELDTYQVLWGGDRVTSGLEHLEAQGVHFRAPPAAGGLVLNAGGQRDGGVLVLAGGIVPNDVINDGEGGLHFLGTWRVFLTEDGKLQLGARAPSDHVALASLVDARITQLRTDLDTLKSAIGAGFTAVGASTAASGPNGKLAFDSAAAAVPAPAASVASSVVECA